MGNHVMRTIVYEKEEEIQRQPSEASKVKKEIVTIIVDSTEIQ